MSTLSIISVVDDNPSVRAALNSVLSWRGYVVHTFGSAEELLTSSLLNATSCVISDVQMSPMDGLELLATMRARGFATPFMLITAFPDENVRARAMEAGATGFLAKPFAMRTLITCLDAALGGGLLATTDTVPKISHAHTHIALCDALIRSAPLR